MTIIDYFKPWATRLVVLLAITVCLSGCSTTNLWESQEAVTLTAADTQKIAKDVVDLLLDEYPLEKTTFALNRDKRIGTFGKALESQLRKTGYALAANGRNARKLRYVLDQLAVGLYRVDIRIESTYRMGLVYRLNGEGRLVLSIVTARSNSGRVVSDYKIPAGINDGDINREAPNNTSNQVATVNTVPLIADLRLDKEKQKVKSVVLSKQSGVSKPWAVQVISLRENNTKALAAIKRKVEAMGYDATIVEVDGVKKARVGPFGSLAVARPVLDEMRINGYPDAFLWREGRGR